MTPGKNYWLSVPKSLFEEVSWSQDLYPSEALYNTLLWFQPPAAVVATWLGLKNSFCYIENTLGIHAVPPASNTPFFSDAMYSLTKTITWQTLYATLNHPAVCNSQKLWTSISGGRSVHSFNSAPLCPKYTSTPPHFRWMYGNFYSTMFTYSGVFLHLGTVCLLLLTVRNASKYIVYLK